MSDQDKTPGSGMSTRTKLIAGGIVTVLAGGIAFSLETGSWLGVGVLGALGLGGGLVLWMLKIAGVFDPPEAGGAPIPQRDDPPDRPTS